MPCQACTESTSGACPNHPVRFIESVAAPRWVTEDPEPRAMKSPVVTLTDALAIVERSVAYADAQMREAGIEPADDATYTVVAAARLVADAPEWLQALLENPPDEPHEMWVCETHRHQGNHASCCFDTAKKMGDVYAAAGGEWRPSVNTCRMVRRLLVDPGNQQEDE